MRSIMEDVRASLEAGKKIVLSTVVDVERRAPRDPGAAMFVDEDGRVAGSLSGGCIEPAIIEESRRMLADGETARLVTFGISDEQAFGVGLSCGGTVHVVMEPVDPGDPADAGDASTAKLLQSLHGALEQGDASVALVTVLAGGNGRSGAALLVDASGRVEGSAGDPDLDRRMIHAATECLRLGVSKRMSLGDTDVFIQAFTPPPVMYIIGAVHPAAALASAGKFLGYRVVVCDPRSPFATPERLPAADEIAKEWPDRYLARQEVTPRDAVCVLTHDLKFDVPAIQAALRTPVGYIGAMGSRRTHARRVEALAEAGVGEGELARVSAPIGLDIGARTPEEIAVAIMAEIVAKRTEAEASLTIRG